MGTGSSSLLGAALVPAWVPWVWKSLPAMGICLLTVNFFHACTEILAFSSFNMVVLV